MEPCQLKMNELLNRSGDMTTEDVDLANKLAEFFRKASSTPNYVMDIGITASTVTAVLINLASIVVNKDLVAQLLKTYFSI